MFGCFVCFAFGFFFQWIMHMASRWLSSHPARTSAFTLVSAFSALISTTSNNLYNDLAEATKALGQKKVASPGLAWLRPGLAEPRSASIAGLQQHNRKGKIVMIKTRRYKRLVFGVRFLHLGLI